MLASQTVQLAFAAAALMGNLISPIYASPYALPLPLANRVASQASVYSPSSQPNTSIAYRQNARAAMPFPVDVNFIERRDSLSDLVASLTLSSYHMRDMASRADQEEDNEQFHQQAASALREHTSILGKVADIFQPLGTNKGLANYDKDVPLETTLKQIVNTSKDTLSSVSDMTDRLPLVGPILGPIVYDLKCILDSTLNLVENTTDGVLNNLKPLLVGCIRDYGSYACGPGALELVGICLNGLLVGNGLGGLGLGL